MNKRDKKLELVPMTQAEAKVFVKQNHRHHGPPQGSLFQIGAAKDGRIVAVAIVGRPVSRMLDDGWTAEVTRLASDGTFNACSVLYAACWRAARAMGYKRLITYTLDSEPGGSLRAAGFRLVAQCAGGSWSRRERPRVDKHPTQGKFRWEAGAP
jgi:tRNA A37 N6-isopentenylltransferase MiaA